MPIRAVENFTAGHNDRSHWTLFEPGKAKVIYADTEAEAKAEAAKIKNPIVVPPATSQGSNFVAAAGAGPVVLDSPAAAAAASMPGLGKPSIGKITATATAIDGGFRISIAGEHVTPGEKMNYFLDAKISGAYYPMLQLAAGQVLAAS